MEGTTAWPQSVDGSAHPDAIDVFHGGPINGRGVFLENEKRWASVRHLVQ